MAIPHAYEMSLRYFESASGVLPEHGFPFRSHGSYNHAYRRLTFLLVSIDSGK